MNKRMLMFLIFSFLLNGKLFGHAETGPDGHGDQGHGDRVVGAHHEHGEHVPAEVVGAQPVGRRGRLQLAGDVQIGDRVGRPGKR